MRIYDMLTCSRSVTQRMVQVTLQNIADAAGRTYAALLL